MPQVVVQQYNALYLYQVCYSTGMYQVPVVVTVVTLTCFTGAVLRLLLLLLHAAVDALYWCCSIYVTAPAAPAPAAQYCCSTTKRMPRYYYCVREAHTLISLASPSFGCALSMHIHAPWLVVLTVLAVFSTPSNLPPNGYLV